MDKILSWLGMAMDATGIGASNSEKAYHRYGSSVVEMIKLSQGWYSLNMSPFKSALEDGVLTDIPRHDNILSNLFAFEVIGGVPKLPTKKNAGKDSNGKKDKRHGDTAVALALLYYAFMNLNDGELVIKSRQVEHKETMAMGILTRFKKMIKGYD